MRAFSVLFVKGKLMMKVVWEESFNWVNHRQQCECWMTTEKQEKWCCIYYKTHLTQSHFRLFFISLLFVITSRMLFFVHEWTREKKRMRTYLSSMIKFIFLTLLHRTIAMSFQLSTEIKNNRFSQKI